MACWASACGTLRHSAAPRAFHPLGLSDLLLLLVQLLLLAFRRRTLEGLPCACMSDNRCAGQTFLTQICSAQFGWFVCGLRRPAMPGLLPCSRRHHMQQL